MSLKGVKSGPGAESPFRCGFDIPGPTNGRRSNATRLSVFASEEGFDFDFDFDFDFGFGFGAGVGQTTDRRPTGGVGCNGSCGVSGMEALEEPALGALHIQSRFGIGLGLGQVIQFRQSDVWPQIALATR